MSTNGTASHTNGTSKPVPSIEEVRELTKRLRVVNRYKHALLEANALESLDYNGFSGSDTYERFWRDRDTSGAQWVSAALPQDRKGGRKWPLWFTDLDLQRLRQASRILCSSNDFAKALLRNRTNYIIGTGMDYQVGPKEQAQDVEEESEDEQKTKWIEKLAKGVKSWIVDFCERNNWNTSAESDEEDEDGAVSSASSTKERECHWRVDRDGEAFIRLFCHENGKVEARFVGPEMIWGMPPGKTQNDGWYFGVQHRVIDGQLDLEKVVAYYVRPRDVSFVGTATDSERDSLGGEIVPAREMIHIKDPWEDAEVARGTPAFSYDCMDALLRASSLQKNMSISANVRAATAEVWKHTVGTAGEIRSLQNASPGGRTVVGVDGNERSVQPTYPGMIRRIPQSQEPVPFPTTTNVPEHQQAMQGDLRQAASGFCAPEYMTGTTNESNYACHDSETELMTRRGWLRYDQVKYGDVAGTMNPETQEFEWQDIQSIHIYDNYDGEMIRLHGRTNLDAMLTPNHRMWTTRPHRKMVDGKNISELTYPWGFVRADELRNGDVLPFACKPKMQGIPVECFDIPPAFYASNNQHSRKPYAKVRTVPMNPFLSFLGWWLSEGWIGNNEAERANHYCVGVCQDHRQVNECESIRGAIAGLASGGILLKEGLGKNGMHYWKKDDKSLFMWLKNNCGSGSYSKYIPGFVHDLPSYQQSVLLESLIAGDGSDKKSRRVQPNGNVWGNYTSGLSTANYFSVSKKLIDDFQRVAIQCGYISGIRKQMTNGVYPVTARVPDRILTVQDQHISRVPYKGVVWCVRVENQLLITRRNGKTLISGNTAREAGTPFVNAAEAEQEHYKTAFLRLMWRVVRWAVKCGKLPQEALKLIKISVEAGQVKKDNEGELASARNINLQNKITSPQIEAAKIGNDPKQVLADWKKWNAEMPQQGGMPGGAGGMPGQEEGGQPGGDPNNPLAGVPQEDLSQHAGGGGASASKHIADPKRSQAAKMAWAKRAHAVSESAEGDGWFDVPEDVLGGIL